MITPAPPAPRERTEEYEKAEDHEKDEGHEKAEDHEKADEHENADDSITAWALAARAGDPDAVDRFVRALHRDVLRYVAHLCADPQAVDDLAQDTFLRALGSLHRFEGRSSARAWLLSIARRAVIDSYRYAATRPRLSDVPDWRLAVELAQPRDLPGFDDGIALLDLLAALPEERREAFVLTQLLGLPYAEAAALSDCPIGTVRSRVNRARATLIDLLTAADEPTVLVA
ncbi:sigma-70 family RNA polymerase sigma factor [Streptomyces sp. TRM72054]|uniref:sigma-70 family RNA polymerase sigma factor n=1 Tax=Streptomyces sp. TRM72054 TaxID=2870562 RepID=UPI001C8B6534|nr:sigma-70 family RNA polymerase sigma factor [Streptomyces sp. TRM72054]MBX9392557.1 sigma-70 family RNA polymerase sigma factor [Streptomyces sp. TRM72054]